MELTGEYRIKAPREKVWEALNDPDVLRQALPGCEELEQSADNEFTAKVKAKVGPVNAKFAGKVTLSDINEPESYKISGEGSGGAAGFAKGSAKVELKEEGDGVTLLSYNADAQVGGKLAQIGSRLVKGTARKMADQFFGNFSELVGAPAEPVDHEPAKEAKGLESGDDAETASQEQPEESSGKPEAAADTAKGSDGSETAAAGSSQEKSAEPAGERAKANAKPASGGVPMVAWVGGAVIVVIILLLIFT